MKERMLSLGLIRQALVEAREALPDMDSVRRALEGMDEIIEFWPGDLVQYETANGEWIDGVVVAHALHRPCYICGAGDDRNDMRDPLLSCPRKYLRLRMHGHSDGPGE